MRQQVNKVYTPLFKTSKRYYILMGGRSAGRSTVASQYALAKLVAPEYFRCAIMRFVLSDIRNSIYQEIIDRAEEQDVKDELDIRENTLQIEYGQNRINGVGFRKSSGDQKSKLKSLANYTTVIVEEADEVSEEDFTQLDDSLRTVKGDIRIILLLNPPDKNHWIIRRWFNLVPAGVDGFYKPALKEIFKDDTCFIHTNFKDNIVNIDKTTQLNFERYKLTNSDHYYNMILGLVSEGRKGRIFKNWLPCPVATYDEQPYEESYYLDFGFSNDPTAFGSIKEHNETLWVRELMHETGLTNQMISRRWTELGVSKSARIFADSAEPKSIEELRTDGWNVIPSPKGADSIKAGIDTLLGYQVYYTEDSANIAKEQQEYRWALDKNKEPINKPVDEFNHHMDGIRYNVHTRRTDGFVGFV